MGALGEIGRRGIAGAVLGGLGALALTIGLGACSEEELGGPRPGTVIKPPDGDGIDLGEGTSPPPLDSEGYCGNQIHQPVREVSNIYFLIDASGSMSTSAGSGTTRYQRVQGAAVNLVRQLGSLINVGGAVFPIGGGGEDGCGVGGEVLAVRPGDPYVKGQGKGPTTRALEGALSVSPLGGTPLAATLEALTPGLAALEGRTIVVLATDGGPNCNYEASCSASDCIPYVEGACGSTCCSPQGLAGPSGCVDRANAVAAVSALAARGITVYVIGIPGSEVYGGVLDQLAVAGGAPQFVSPFYYKVDDLGSLGGVLAEIAGGVISCAFDLQSEPPEEGMTNVYLDGKVLPYGEENGWRWTSPTVVELTGDACEALKLGQVREVQIVSGCPTEAAK
ncbi:vWA domain-containing protein [Chondromyces crocatus]|uniref:VWFA domain-containing protein n=1 Tax=Chondromyces crocatus TaxID=52 RepID=A0A0K1EKL4_CHOCO|nr:hypothetical protein [Chondromyces crocatus]AKT41391.1 uncharacterized protein CMC5_055910 [Chondromyces crocatus]